jgi:ferrochelatase
MSGKTAVVLFNLGGPDSPQSIQPFLFNFFRDPNVVRLPAIFRWLLAWWISFSRSKGAAKSSYNLIGGRSPLLENTQAQQGALEAALGNGFRVFTCMRYWHPLTEAVVADVRAYAPDNIVLLPLYPQYSTTTTRSSLRTWKHAFGKPEVPVSLVCCYPADAGFIAASVKLVKKVLDQARTEAKANNLPEPRLLFSAHGLPESIVRDGDPYAWQCEQTALAVNDSLNIPGLDWTLCYQSRVGRQKWTTPTTAEELQRAAIEGRPVVIYPLAFTQEHVETLAEIEIEYRHLAQRLGVPAFYRVPTVGTEPEFIASLAATVRGVAGKSTLCPTDGKRLCPSYFRRCCMQEEKTAV